MAVNPEFASMPVGDVTVEFWARAPTTTAADQQPIAVFLSYAANIYSAHTIIDRLIVWLTD